MYSTTATYKKRFTPSNSMPQKESKTVATRLPKALSDKFKEALFKSPYLTSAEFLRAAVAEKIKKMEEEQ